MLIYKATEVVNFAQGELLMLGAFCAYTYIGILGMLYGLGALLAIVPIVIFGGLLDRVVMRPVVGQPTFAYVIFAEIRLRRFFINCTLEHSIQSASA